MLQGLKYASLLVECSLCGIYRKILLCLPPSLKFLSLISGVYDNCQIARDYLNVNSIDCTNFSIVTSSKQSKKDNETNTYIERNCTSRRHRKGISHDSLICEIATQLYTCRFDMKSG